MLHNSIQRSARSRRQAATRHVIAAVPSKTSVRLHTPIPAAAAAAAAAVEAGAETAGVIYAASTIIDIIPSAAAVLLSTHQLLHHF